MESLRFFFLLSLFAVIAAFNNRISNLQFGKHTVSHNRRIQRSALQLPATSPNKNKDKMKDKNVFFGFTEKAEVLNGRIAMTFFAVGIYEELVTGKSIIEQAGFGDPNQQLNGLELAGFFAVLALIPNVNKFLKRVEDKKVE
jgi:hypothetical protein